MSGDKEGRGRYEIGEVCTEDDGVAVEVKWRAADYESAVRALEGRFTPLHFTWIQRQMERGHDVELTGTIRLRYFGPNTNTPCSTCGGMNWLREWDRVPRGHIYKPCAACNVSGAYRQKVKTEKIETPPEAA